MMFRDKLALTLPPLLLRLFLAATFIWAGYGKLFSTMTVEPGQAAILANMGVNIAPPAVDVDPAPETAPDTLDEPLPEADPPRDAVDEMLDSEPDREPAPPEPAEPLDPAPPPPGAVDDDERRADAQAFRFLLASTDDADAAGSPAKIYTADDFTGPVIVRQVYGVTLALHSAGHPEADGARPLVPDWMLTGSRPVQLAWTVGAVELLGGVLVLFGFLTRVAALALACVMGMAMWLTSIGPVALGPPGTESFLGFLPPLNDFAPQAWMEWLWQLALLMSALALALSRPGLLALDGLIFASGRGTTAKPVSAK